MPDQPESDRRVVDRKNDNHFLTPLLLMALIVACGILVMTYA
jgi:hypothetical protein